jgi:thioesterase domain-containing protein
MMSKLCLIPFIAHKFPREYYWVQLGRVIKDFAPKERYPGRVAFFAAQSRIAKAAVNPTSSLDGWREVVRGQFDISVVPGDHFSMFEEPNIQVLANQLTRLLRND